MQHQSNIEKLPDELVHLILANLPLRNLALSNRVCRKLHQYADYVFDHLSLAQVPWEEVLTLICSLPAKQAHHFIVRCRLTIWYQKVTEKILNHGDTTLFERVCQILITDKLLTVKQLAQFQHYDIFNILETCRDNEDIHLFFSLLNLGCFNNNNAMYLFLNKIENQQKRGKRICLLYGYLRRPLLKPLDGYPGYAATSQERRRLTGDFSYGDFRGFNFGGNALFSANLNHCNLSGADLRDVVFKETTLQGALTENVLISYLSNQRLSSHVKGCIWLCNKEYKNTNRSNPKYNSLIFDLMDVLKKETLNVMNNHFDDNKENEELLQILATEIVKNVVETLYDSRIRERVVREVLQHPPFTKGHRFWFFPSSRPPSHHILLDSLKEKEEPKCEFGCNMVKK